MLARYTQKELMKYDAILVVSFGGPEQPADVMPFLENVLRGKNVPRERMLEVAEPLQRARRKEPHQRTESPIDFGSRSRVGRSTARGCLSTGEIATGIRCSRTRCDR